MKEKLSRYFYCLPRAAASSLGSCSRSAIRMRLKPVSSAKWWSMGKSSVHAAAREGMHRIKLLPDSAQVHIYPMADTNMGLEKWPMSAHGRCRLNTDCMTVWWQDNLGRHSQCGALGRKRGVAIPQQAEPRTQAWKGPDRAIDAAWSPRWRLSNRARKKSVSGRTRNLTRRYVHPRRRLSLRDWAAPSRRDHRAPGHR